MRNWGVGEEFRGHWFHDSTVGSWSINNNVGWIFEADGFRVFEKIDPRPQELWWWSFRMKCIYPVVRREIKSEGYPYILYIYIYPNEILRVSQPSDSHVKSQVLFQFGEQPCDVEDLGWIKVIFTFTKNQQPTIMNSARNWVFSTGWWFGTFFMFPYFGKNNRRKFRSQTSDNMDRWKAEQGRGREKRKIRRKKSRRERVKKEDADARKGRKVAKHCVFPMICGSGGSKSRLAKAAGAEPAGQMSDEKLHAVVARSAFRSQNVQNTPVSDHFWKLRCQKSARRCGAKHISKSKCTKHTSVGPLLEVEMSKKCTPLWREAHYQVKMYKTHQCRTTFGSWDVEKVHAVRTTFGSWDVEKVHAVVARSTFPSQNVQSTTCSRHFWRFGCWKSARRCGAKHISKSKCTKHHMFAPLLEVRMLKKCTPLWREAHFEVNMYKTLGVRTTFGGSDVASPLRFTTLHYVTLHHTPLYYITLHYTTLHNTTTTTTQLDYTPLH